MLDCNVWTQDFRTTSCIRLGGHEERLAPLVNNNSAPRHFNNYSFHSQKYMYAERQASHSTSKEILIIILGNRIMSKRYNF